MALVEIRRSQAEIDLKKIESDMQLLERSRLPRMES